MSVSPPIATFELWRSTSHLGHKRKSAVIFGVPTRFQRAFTRSGNLTLRDLLALVAGREGEGKLKARAAPSWLRQSKC
jgi:hypothetical protein